MLRQLMVPIVVGLGLFWLCQPASALAIRLLYSLGATWENVLLTQAFSEAAMCAGALLAPILFRRLSADYRFVPLFATFVVAFCIALQPLLAPITHEGIAALCILSALMGLADAFIFLFWIERLRHLHSEKGRTYFIVAIVGANLFFQIVQVVLGHATLAQTSSPWAIAGMSLLSIGGVLLCQLYASRDSFGKEPAQQGAREASPRDRSQTERRCRVTVYSFVLLVSFGIMYGIALSTFFHPASENSFWNGAPTLLVGIVSLAALYFAIKNGVKFGMLVRCLLAVCGLELALLGILAELAPWLIGPICTQASTPLGLCIMIFTIEASLEQNLPIIKVASLSIALFRLGCVPMLVLFWVLQTLLGGPTSWSLIAAFAVVAMAMAIPMLPSASSNAGTFMLKTIPENESFDEMVDRRREEIASEFGLSPRETEVLGLILKGLSRDQIAEALYLSKWTVKEYTSAIYAKTGVHSYKELVSFAVGIQK